MLFNRPQGLDCTWPRFGSASQVRFENSPALRTLTTSTFKSEEEEEKGSLPACSSWVVSACLATYIGYVPCVSIRPCQRWYSHHRNTFLTSFKYSESCVQNSKSYVVSCVASTQQACFPTGAGELYWPWQDLYQQFGPGVSSRKGT